MRAPCATGSANAITAAGGIDTVQAGNGTNTITLGNNLVAVGPGSNSVKVGNGRYLLIDGTVQLTRSGDSFRQVLSDWTPYGAAPANVADLPARLHVTYYSNTSTTLQAGSGLDWFWAQYAKDRLNKKASDLLG